MFKREGINMNDYLKTKELYHWGIKGQKWGVRRYQNEDGTLTESGRARYNSDLTEKDPKKMTDEDLRKSSQRIQAEQNYKMLRSKEKTGSQISKTALTTAIAVGASVASTYAASRIFAMVTNNDNLTKGKSALLSILAGMNVGVGVLGGRIGQVSAKSGNRDGNNL